MSISDISPCKNCKDRHLKCHGDCTKYAEFRTRCDEVKKTRATFYRGRYGYISEEEYRKGAEEIHARRISRKD